MKKTSMLLAFLLVITHMVYSQDDLYTALEKLPEGTTFTQYYSIGEANAEGKYTSGGRRFGAWVEVAKLPTGTPTGITVKFKGKDSGKTIVAKQMDEKNYGRNIGYPEISVLKHKYDKTGFVMVENYLVVLKKVSEDGLSFKGIEYIFIKDEVSKPGIKKVDGAKKKMSFKEKLAAAKNKMAGAYSMGPEYKKMAETNMRKLILDYLQAMKQKQDAMSPSQKAKAKELVTYRENYDEYVKNYNDSIKATPEHQRMVAHQKRMAKNINVEVKNNSNHTYWIGSSKEAFIVTELPAGSSRTMTCTGNLYYYGSNTKGSVGRLFYTADSACGGSVSVN